MSISELAEMASAVGVALVALQLLLGRFQARTALEDELSRQYREIAAQIPPVAFFDGEDPEYPMPPISDHLVEFLRYFDLTNQQIFLRAQRRVSTKTWTLWRDGICDNLSRPGFREAWIFVRLHIPKSYDELASLDGRWSVDPAWWAPPWWAVPLKQLRRCPDQPEPGHDHR